MTRRTVALLGVLLLSLLNKSAASSRKDPKGSHVNKETKNATTVMSLGESLRKTEERAKTMQNYWEKTLAEIKNLAVNFTDIASSKGGSSLTQWKLLLDEDATTRTSTEEKKPKKLTLPRFEGFASWERKLQLWADEVADYIERTQNETTEYPFSTYGRPSLAKNVTELVEEETLVNGAGGKEVSL